MIRIVEPCACSRFYSDSNVDDWKEGTVGSVYGTRICLFSFNSVSQKRFHSMVWALRLQIAFGAS